MKNAIKFALFWCLNFMALAWPIMILMSIGEVIGAPRAVSALVGAASGLAAFVATSFAFSWASDKGIVDLKFLNAKASDDEMGLHGVLLAVALVVAGSYMVIVIGQAIGQAIRS